jgi:hypothetical protein
MFSRIRKRITYANVAMTLALVFAMSGGAYAASKYLITSTKQINPKVLKALKGKNGTNGANGTNGVNGKDGAAGTQGLNGGAGEKGEKGASGESVAYKEVPTSDKTKCGGLGGAEYTVGGKTTLICNGQTGFTETLPAGKTEKGMWAAAAPEGGIATEGVSFNIPLKSAPTVHYINVGEKELTATSEVTSTVCTGTAANPTASEGALCVYAHLEGHVSDGNVPGDAINNEHFFNWKWGVIVDTEGGEGGAGVKPDTATPFGFDVTALGHELGFVKVNGSFAVTG